MKQDGKFIVGEYVSILYDSPFIHLYDAVVEVNRSLCPCCIVAV